MTFEEFSKLLTQIAHVISMGGNLLEMRLDKPYRVIFCVNTAASKVFSKASQVCCNKKIFVVTALPLECLNLILLDELLTKSAPINLKRLLWKVAAGCPDLTGGKVVTM
jgi:hypothetical protein